jgi:hypothetical protein
MSEQTSQDNTQDVNGTPDTVLATSVPETKTETKSVAETLYDANTEEKKTESVEVKAEDATDKKVEEKTEEIEKKEPEKAAEVKASDDQLVLDKPKNSRLSDADMERIASYSKDQGLSKDAAQKLVEQESLARDSFMVSLQAQHQQMVQQWADDVKSDKELGGERFAESAELAKRVVDRFGTDAFRKNLNESGYGNHPEVVRIFARIGKAMAPDSLVLGGKQSGGAKSMADIFYGE